MIINKQTSFFLILTLASIFLLSGSLDNLVLQPGEKAVFTNETEQKSERVEESVSGDHTEVNPPVWIIYLFFLPLFYVLYKTTRKIQWGSPRDMDWKTLFLFTLLSFALVLLLSFLFLYWYSDGQIGNTAMDFREPELIFNPVFQTEISKWIIYLIAGILVASLLGIGWGIRKYLRRKDQSELPADMIIGKALETLSKISSGRDLKETIINCYKQMCLILSEIQGVDRKPTMTAGEFADQLAHLGFADEHITDLTRLFEKVRYGSSENRENETSQAVLCLEAIATQYRGKNG